MDVNKENENSFRSASMISDGSSSPIILTHRSANLVNIPPPVKPRTKIPSQNLENLETDAANKNFFCVEKNTIQSSSEMSNHSRLNSVFSFESKSVDLVLEDTRINWKYISGKLKFMNIYLIGCESFKKLRIILKQEIKF